jgi:hypothetical protein
MQRGERAVAFEQFRLHRRRLEALESFSFLKEE